MYVQCVEASTTSRRINKQNLWKLLYSIIMCTIYIIRRPGRKYIQVEIHTTYSRYKWHRLGSRVSARPNYLNGRYKRKKRRGGFAGYKFEYYRLISRCACTCTVKTGLCTSGTHIIAKGAVMKIYHFALCTIYAIFWGTSTVLKLTLDYLITERLLLFVDFEPFFGCRIHFWPEVVWTINDIGCFSNHIRWLLVRLTNRSTLMHATFYKNYYYLMCAYDGCNRYTSISRVISNEIQLNILSFITMWCESEYQYYSDIERTYLDMYIRWEMVPMAHGVYALSYGQGMRNDLLSHKQWFNNFNICL